MKTTSMALRENALGLVLRPMRIARIVLPMLYLLATEAASTADPSDDYTYTTNGGTVTVTGYTGSGGDVVIPETIEGLPVTSIGHHAFMDSGLSSVTIPGSVTNIGQAAFFNCQNLGSVIIPDSVTYLGGGVFFGCSSMTDASIGNGVPEIQHDMFNGCNLAYVTIGSSVTYIDSWAFAASSPSSHLKGVYFRGNAPGLDSSAFYNNVAVVVFYLPGSSGWGATYGGFTTIAWDPEILTDSDTYDFGVGSDGFEFTIHAGGFMYTYNYITVVEACTNLATGEWIPLQTNFPIGFPYYYFNDPQWTNHPARFYRIDMP